MVDRSTTLFAALDGTVTDATLNHSIVARSHRSAAASCLKLELKREPFLFGNCCYILFNERRLK
jgi:hypothetical protein